MNSVYVVITPAGFILGVYTTYAAADAYAKAYGEQCRISNEPVIAR